MLRLLLGIAVDKLDTDLLGESELDVLALGLTQLGGALLNRDGGLLDLGLDNTLLLGHNLAGEAGKSDGLVGAGLDGLGVADADRDILGGDNRDIVLGLLGNLLAVLVAIRVVAMAIAGLADSHHLDVGLPLESDLNGLGLGILVLLAVVVDADLVVHSLSGLGAHSAGNLVTVFTLNNLLDGKVNIFARGLESGSAHLSLLSHVLNRAVVLGLLIAIRRLVVRGVRGLVRGLVSRLVGLVGRLRLVRLVSRLGGLVGLVRGVRVAGVLVGRLGLVRRLRLVRGLRLVGGLGLGLVLGRLGGLGLVGGAGPPVEWLAMSVGHAVVVAVGAAMVGEGGIGAGAGDGGGHRESAGEGKEGLGKEGGCLRRWLRIGIGNKFW